MNQDERDPQRRQDDRDRFINSRIDILERTVDKLTSSVGHLEGSIATVKLEQSHLKELMDARLRIIEKNQELGMAQMTQISRDIVQMGSDITKTPAGQLLNSYIETVRTQVEDQASKLREQTATQAELTTWQNRVDGVLFVLKWTGAGGIIALVITVLRMVLGK